MLARTCTQHTGERQVVSVLRRDFPIPLWSGEIRKTERKDVKGQAEKRKFCASQVKSVTKWDYVSLN